MRVDGPNNGIPIPRVPGPPISAPKSAREWESLIPAPEVTQHDEIATDAALDHAGEVLKGRALDLVWAAAKAVNKVLWRSPAPNPPRPHTPGSWTFSALGDYGGGHSPQPEIARNVAAGKPDLLLTLGDNVYYDGLESEWQKKWDPPQLFGRLRETIPVRPSLGNHDLRRDPDGVPYFKRFPELDGARFYSFDDKGVHFVSLNSNESLAPGSPQLEWLDKDLAKSTADWKVLYLHHPLLKGNGAKPGPVDEYLAPLIARHGVDLILAGHEHSYQRSKPLNAAGALQITSGGGGQSLHYFRQKVPDWTAYRDVDFGHVEVEVTDDELVGRYVVRDGSVRDTFTIPNATPGTPPAPPAS